MFSQWYLFNFPLLTFSLLSGGIYNFTSTTQRSEKGRKRGRERVWFESLESRKFIEIFWNDLDLVSQWVLFLGIREMKVENFFIIDSITLCGWWRTNWVCAVTFGCRSWCDCQRCEMRERDEKWRVRVRELGEERERLWDWQGSVY